MLWVKCSFHLRSCLSRVNIFYKKNYQLRDWRPVLVEFQSSYYQVLEMHLQIYRSQITIKKSLAVLTASSTAVYCYCQQYSSSYCEQYNWTLYGRIILWVKFSFHLRSCSSRVNIFYKNDHLRDWKPVLVEFQNSYYQVLEMQMQLYRSQITI